jgi:hypothetical protein
MDNHSNTSLNNIGLSTAAADQIAAFLKESDGKISSELRGRILNMMIVALTAK